MRYVTINEKGHPTAGVIVGDEVLNLKAGLSQNRRSWRASKRRTRDPFWR